MAVLRRERSVFDLSEGPCSAEELVERMRMHYIMLRVISNIPDMSLNRRAELNTKKMAQWADETDADIEPRPHLEPFYTLVALQLGDPEGHPWLTVNAVDFYNMYREYCKAAGLAPEFDDPGRAEGHASILLSYIFWYERNRPKLTHG